MNMIEETLKVLLKLRSYFQPSTNLPGVRISSPSIRQHGQGKACPVPIPVSRCDGSRSRCKTVAENNIVLLEEKLDYLIILAIINFIDHFLQVLFSL